MSSLIDDSDASRSAATGESPSISLDKEPGGSDPRDEEVRRLRGRLDEVTQQLLVARDAAVGADAERSVARARASELEHYLHVKTTEVEELTSKLLMLTEVKDRPIGARGSRGPGRIRRRLARMSGRGRRAVGTDR